MSADKKIKITIENFNDFSSRLDISKAQCELTAKEIARLFQEIYSHDDVEKAVEHFREAIQCPSPQDEIAFLGELCNSPFKNAIKSYVFIGSNESTPAGAHSKISFVKNKYADSAFEIFSRSVANAKPNYASSFKESCEDVTDGRCEFCILPIANSLDGRLMSFYSLLDRYELKICEIASVEDEDSSQSVFYARIGRSCKELNEKQATNQTLIFEFSVLASNAEFISPLLLAAHCSDAKIISINSTPVEYDSSLQRFFFSFYLKASKALPFRLYVSLLSQSYTPIGFYKGLTSI